MYCNNGCNNNYWWIAILIAIVIIWCCCCGNGFLGCGDDCYGGNECGGCCR